MSLQPRHKWMADNVALLIDPEGKDETVRKVEEAIRETANWKKVNDFLEGNPKLIMRQESKF
jgi:hypothetical protein